MKYEERRVSLPDMYPAPEYYDADYGIRREERHRLVETLLAQLTNRERQVIELYYWENYTQSDIAHLLHMQQPNVARTHLGALQKMREYALANNLSP